MVTAVQRAAKRGFSELLQRISKGRNRLTVSRRMNPENVMSKEKFRYAMIYEDIKKAILDHTFEENSLLPTEQDLAATYQVNRTTLRKAMQLLADEGLIDKCPGKGTVVLSRPQEDSGQKKVISNKNIGFLLPRGNLITEPFYATLFSSLEQAFQLKGCSLIYTTLDQEDHLTDKIAPLGLSGIVFVSNVSPRHIQLAVEQKIPCVLVNSYSDRLPSILSDNYRGAYLAGRHLIEHGHRNVAVLAGIRSYISNQERMAGFKQAYSESGLALDPGQIVQSDSWHYPTAEKTFFDFIASHRDSLPTAVFAFNDRLAVGAINAVTKAGLSVPGDISVIGYDNLQYYNIVASRISTVETHIEIIAEATVANMIWQLDGGSCIPVKILAPVEIVPGETVRSCSHTP